MAPQIVTLEQRTGAFTLSKLRQQEKENDAKAAHRTNYEHEEVQKILEEQSEKSKMSLIDQAYQEIEDF